MPTMDLRESVAWCWGEIGEVMSPGEREKEISQNMPEHDSTSPHLELDGTQTRSTCSIFYRPRTLRFRYGSW